MERLLGSGGQGLVYRAEDRQLLRPVALKTLRLAQTSPAATATFLDEAQAAARLEHPNVVPIHDFGELDDGRPFYTMRLVAGRSLEAVLDARRAAPPGATRRSKKVSAPAEDGDEEWSLVRLLQVIQASCSAVQHAHEQGLLHRDVKPSNILLGELGEVLLVDWGIAKALREGRRTTTGVVKGTTPYMSPEQVRGVPLDGRTDVYSLGVVLYECLTEHHPFEGASDAELLAAILRDAPPPPVIVARRPVPEALARIALRALDKDRDARFGSARELHDAIQAWIEGERERARQEVRAERSARQGREALDRHEAACALVDALEDEVERLEVEHPTWQPVAEKRPLLEARSRLERARDHAQDAFLESVNHYTDALAHVPGHVASRRTLADVFWRRFRDAEHHLDAGMARTYRALVERFHDGRYARELRGDGSLKLRVEPDDAELTLHRLREEDLVLVDGPGCGLGCGSISLKPLPMGSYVVVARAEGYHDARYPVWIDRCATWEGELRLLPEGELPDDFVYVPGTEAWLGGDPLATNGWPLRKVRVESFMMKRHPVTFGEYCEFLDAMGDPDPELLPRTEVEGVLVERSKSGRHVISVTAPSEGMRWPVFGVARAQAEAYARWRSERDGRRYRLPTAEEWELAARGVDRRTYPWGWKFDAALCHVRESLRDPDPVPVGSFECDESIHGIRDLAGCIHEWTSQVTDAVGGREARGGSWHAGGSASRAAFRGLVSEIARGTHIGFRVVAALSAA